MTGAEVAAGRAATTSTPATAGTATYVGAGALLGLAWAAGLRGAMAELAGAGSTVTLSGTFGWMLLPGLVVGALLGWAEWLRRTGGRRGWRWFGLAPLLFAAVVFSDPGRWAQFLQDGLGGGALAVPLFGLLGGWAFADRGPRWARYAVRGLLLAPVPAAVVALAAGVDVTPAAALTAVTFYVFFLVLMLAGTIPHRRPKSR